MKTKAEKTRRMLGEGVPFERIRRITGYIQTLSRFNDAKRAEEHDRVRHVASGSPACRMR